MRRASATRSTNTATAPLGCARAAARMCRMRSAGVAASTKRGDLRAFNRRRTAGHRKSAPVRLSTAFPEAPVADSVMVRNSGTP